MAYPKLTPIVATGTTEPRYIGDRFADVVNVKDFGAKGDGVTDDTTPILSAISQSTQTKRKLVFGFNERYKITGETDLVFKYGADFNNSMLDISEVTGRVLFKTADCAWAQDTTATSLLQAGSDVAEFSTYAPAWVDYAGVSQHYVKVQTNEYFYTYRGTDVSRVDYNFVTDNGCLLSPMKYELDVSTVTSVSTMAFNPVQIEYSNVCFYIGENYRTGWTSIVCVENASNIKLTNVSFQTAETFEIPDNAEFTVFEINGSGHVVVDGLFFTSPLRNESDTALYNFSLTDSYDVSIENAIGSGSGWAAIGSNGSSRVTYEKSQFYNIDFHNPVREYLKIIDCLIGSRCIHITSLGDMYIERTTFQLNYDEPYYAKETGAALILSRSELCGICDGDLTVKNVKVVTYDSTTPAGDSVNLLKQVFSADDILQSGSKINPVFWNNITVDNVSIVGSKKLNLAVQYAGNENNIVKKGVTTTISNIHGLCEYNVQWGATGKPTVTGNDVVGDCLTLSNIYTLDNVTIKKSASGDYQAKTEICVSNVGCKTSSDEVGTNFILQGTMSAFINCSYIRTVADRLYTSGIKSFIKFNECVFKFPDSGFGLFSGHADSGFEISNSVFYNLDYDFIYVNKPDASDGYSCSGKIKFFGNTFVGKENLSDRDEIILASYNTPQSTVTVEAFPSNFCRANKICISLGANSESTTVVIDLQGANMNKVVTFNANGDNLRCSWWGNKLQLTSSSGSYPVRAVSVLV